MFKNKIYASTYLEELIHVAISEIDYKNLLTFLDDNGNLSNPVDFEYKKNKSDTIYFNVLNEPFNIASKEILAFILVFSFKCMNHFMAHYYDDDDDFFYIKLNISDQKNNHMLIDTKQIGNVNIQNLEFYARISLLFLWTYYAYIKTNNIDLKKNIFYISFTFSQVLKYYPIEEQ